MHVNQDKASDVVQELDIKVNRVHLSPEQQQQLISAADYEDFELEPLHEISGSGRVFIVYIAYYIPFFVLGVAGWVTRHWPINSSKSVFPSTLSNNLETLGFK